MLGSILLLQQGFVLAGSRSREAVRWRSTWSELKGAFCVVVSHPSVNMR